MAKAKAKAAVTKAAVKRKPAKAPAGAAIARVVKAPKKAAAAKAVKPAAAKMAVAKPARKAPVAVAPRKTEPLTLPVAKAVEAPAAKPAPVVRKIAAVATTRADLPPPDGFTLLVDGHFKSQFDDLKGAKAAASELKGRFPMLRVEIYDAAKKARLPA